MADHGRDQRGGVALITGGKRIGAVVATTLARAGVDVALVYNRSRAEADATATEVRALGRRAFSVQADVTSEQACIDAVDATVRELGRLDILINMASLYDAKPFDQLSAADWDRQLAVDLRASFLFSHAAAPVMRRNGGGRIINFADWVAASGRPRYPGYLPYYVAKAGVKALTEGLALELAADQILVNAIAPGPILAPPEMSAEESDAVVKSTPLGRWGGEDEIAKAVMFLVDSGFVTGETIRVDGGRHVK
jgi:NAD(P)-dependent dehydrogenase (short-subunit alcohol dehydrogenase family)